ncbi:MAG TPA: branched-chain amino acid ABC transporter substrate-binding protein [Acidimicrobiales bacterium]|nr:branched-chain amino acid ABC transporter substrate-binding protein [Acidimicrobiales bacterium]
MLRRSPVIAGALAVGAAFGLAACSSGGTPQNSIAGNVVKIAVEGPMTGDQSSTGIDMWRGASLMAATVNQSGGVLGKHIEIVRVNDQAQASRAVAVAERAIGKHIEAVVGPYNSAVGLENLPVYLRAGVVVVRLTSNQKTNSMGITLQPMDYQVAPFEASAVEKMAGHQRVAIVYDTSAYTSGVADQMKTLLTAAGIPVVAYQSFTSTQTQFADVLTAVKASSPTVVYYDGYDPQAEDLVKQAAAMGVPGTCLVDGLAAQGPTFLSTVPLALAQKCVFSGVPTAAQFSDASSYVTAYKAAYHEDPGTWGVFAYDSLGALVHEIQAVGSLSPAKVNAALLHLSGYAGATGTTTIDPATGNRLDPPLVMQIVDPTGHYVVSPDWSQRGALPSLPSL